MNKSPSLFNPSELLKEPPDRLYEACDRLAGALLCSDQPPEDDPFVRLAKMILTGILMDWVAHKHARKGVKERDLRVPDPEQQ